MLNFLIDCVYKVVLDRQPPPLNSLIMVLILYYYLKENKNIFVGTKCV